MRALVGTRKGLMVLEKKSGKWKVAKTHFVGVKASHASYDRHNKWVWAGVAHGHWGPKLHVSKNNGKTFEELSTPKFPESSGLKLKDFWALETDSKGRLYMGVEPAALFYSDDRGATWRLCEGLQTVRGRDKWFGAGTDDTALHSILIDPKDDEHIIIGISVAGVLETRDGGKTWKYLSKGMKAHFMPNPDVEIGQDPHLLAMAPSDPSVIWQQNHCGIFKSEDGGQTWTDLSKAKGVKSGFGWGIAVDENDANVAYTVPALSDEVRIPVNKRLFVQRTRNGGKSWEVLNKGLPKGDCWDIVYRGALALKDKELMFGSTTGNLYFSGNRGNSWKKLDVNLPPIYSVRLF